MSDFALTVTQVDNDGELLGARRLTSPSPITAVKVQTSGQVTALLLAMGSTKNTINKRECVLRLGFPYVLWYSV